MFASNDYLDLANDARVKEAAVDAVKRFGTGTGGSRLTTGTQTIHRELERALAEFKGTEDAIAFATGFAANSGVIPALCSRSDVIFSDELNHASIIDGCRLSGARIVVYRHNDMRDLERKIVSCSPCSGLVVSDAVFSMDGDLLNLPDFLNIAHRYNLFSMIDEAHATGVAGPGGHGILSLFPGVDLRPDILMGTLSKALGSEGGFVCATHEITDYLRNKARSYIFSTAPSPASAAAALAALGIIRTEPERVARLQHNVAFFLKQLHRLGIKAQTESAIVPVIVGDSARALAAAESMRDDGIFVSAIRYPSVPEGTARLRLTVMASHTESDLVRCAVSLAKAIAG
jgi:6-carboxyhexanoate--CoA ligase